MSAEDLRKQLQLGYEITGEVFASGYVRPLNGPSLFDGILQAHGPELSKWLSENGVTVRRM